MRIAVVDLGTNTFNLLVAEVLNGSFKSLYRTKVGVKLGCGGINDGIIIPTAFDRGLNAVGQLIKKIKPYKVDKILATATAGVRSSENGKKFIDTIKDLFKLDVQVITGDKEAELIYRGVRQAVDLNEHKSLILDIGGGSNEFILASDNEIFWKKSFDLGIARLLDKFQPSDPINADEISVIESFIENELSELTEIINEHKPTHLIGSSGTFDTFRSLILARKKEESSDTYYHFNLDEYKSLHNELINSTAEERLLMKGMEPVRVEMIVLASIFVNFILKKYQIENLQQSDYSIKEGVLDEHLNS